jgi:thiol-disulfide isomerase/thioredoxin
MKKTALFLLIVGLIAVGCQSSSSANSEKPKESSSEPQTNRPSAAPFQLTDIAGKPLSLAALKGKVVIIDFWATWCPPCRAEIPHFKELYAQYKDRGLEIVGLSVDNGSAEVVSFVKENKIEYPVAMADGALQKAYGGIRGIPTTFIVDKRGGIAKKYVGYQEKSVFENDIVELLKEA